MNAIKKLFDETERILLALEQGELPKGKYPHLKRAIDEAAAELETLRAAAKNKCQCEQNTTVVYARAFICTECGMPKDLNNWPKKDGEK